MSQINFNQNNNSQILNSFCPFSLEDTKNYTININTPILLDSSSETKSNVIVLDNNINNINNENVIGYFQISYNDNKKINNNTPINIEENPKIPYNDEININFNVSSTYSKSKSKKIQDINLKKFGFKKDKKERIFKIYKDNRNKGRIKKNSNVIGKHNKFSQDNIIRKLKGRFHEKCRIYINKEYKKYLLNHKHDIKKVNDLFQRITPKLSRKIKKVENLKWLQSKLYDVFSENVSEKYRPYDIEHNKKLIEKIYKDDEAKDIIDILNKPVKYMFDAYIRNMKIPGFETLNDDIIELREKMEKENQEDIDIYLSKYRIIAQNLETIFIKKKSRNNK